MLMNVYAGNGQGKAARTAEQERPGIPRNNGTRSDRVRARGARGARTLRRRDNTAPMPRN